MDQKISDKFAERGMRLANALMRQLTNNAHCSPVAETASDAAPVPQAAPKGTELTAAPSGRRAAPRPTHASSFSTSWPHANEASHAGISAKFVLG